MKKEGRAHAPAGRRRRLRGTFFATGRSGHPAPWTGRRRCRRATADGPLRDTRKTPNHVSKQGGDKNERGKRHVVRQTPEKHHGATGGREKGKSLYLARWPTRVAAVGTFCAPRYTPLRTPGSPSAPNWCLVAPRHCCHCCCCRPRGPLAGRAVVCCRCQRHRRGWWWQWRWWQRQRPGAGRAARGRGSSTPRPSVPPPPGAAARC